MVSVSDGEAAARGGFAFSNGHSRRWLKAWGGFPRCHDNLTVFMEVRGGGWCLGLLGWGVGLKTLETRERGSHPDSGRALWLLG